MRFCLFLMMIFMAVTVQAATSNLPASVSYFSPITILPIRPMIIPLTRSSVLNEALPQTTTSVILPFSGSGAVYLLPGYQTACVMIDADPSRTFLITISYSALTGSLGDTATMPSSYQYAWTSNPDCATGLTAWSTTKPTSVSGPTYIAIRDTITLGSGSYSTYFSSGHPQTYQKDMIFSVDYN